MKVGQKISVKLRGLPERPYTITYIGPYSIKLMDAEGNIHMTKKSKIRYQLYGPLKDSNRASSSVDSISIPFGGQPDSKKR